MGFLGPGPRPPISGGSNTENPNGIVAIWSDVGLGRDCGVAFPGGRAGTC